MQETKSECYYKSFGMCTCKGTATDEKRCENPTECPNYISESQFFMDSMNGKDMDQMIKRAGEQSTPKKQYDLSLGKSKKALKREAKLEAQKNGVGTGYSLKDDPRFKDLFK